MGVGSKRGKGGGVRGMIIMINNKRDIII